MMNINHTATAKHMRKRLRIAGIKAKCKAYEACGLQYIAINPPAFEVKFTEQEQEIILRIASVNHCTLARGKEIDVTARTFANTAIFEYHGPTPEGNEL